VVARKPLVIALGALAALALVARRRRGQAAEASPESNGSTDDSRESLRRFVEAGERLRSAERPSTEP
jgi:hypothetical protein